MAAFLLSSLLAAAMIGVVVNVGRRRRPGTPLTWGEAFVAAFFIFVLLFVLYGIVPHQFLAWADNELKWRSDKIGIPTGPLPIGGAKHLLFPKGIPLPNGTFVITAQVLRDVIAAGLYIVFLVGQILMWLWWQNRGKVADARPAIATSSYGRPLVRET